jgi:hypothetical protein
MRFIAFEGLGGQPALGVRFGNEVADLAPLGVAATLERQQLSRGAGPWRACACCRRSAVRQRPSRSV